MENNKLETISNLFEGNEIRSFWDAEKEEYYFSVVDVIRGRKKWVIDKMSTTEIKIQRWKIL